MWVGLIQLNLKQCTIPECNLGAEKHLPSGESSAIPNQ